MVEQNLNKKKIFKLSIADSITITRLLASPIVIITTLLYLKNLTGYIVAIALFTDLVDGQLARLLKSKSETGTKLDSIADGAIFFTSVFSVIWFFTDFVIMHWIWIAVIFAIYFFQIGYALIRYGRISTFHKYSAKMASFPIGIFIVTSYFIGPVEWLFYLSCIAGVLVEMEEIALITILPEPRDNVKGLYWVLKEKRA